MNELDPSAEDALKLLVEAERALRARFETDSNTGTVAIIGMTAPDGSYHAFVRPIVIAQLVE